MAVVIETSQGDITVDLYTDERPRCCLNFLKLCKIKYYNCCLFHSVQKNLVAQTGDPTGTGKGGQSMFGKVYGEQAAFFEQETKPRIKHRKKGLVSMVNNGSNGHGSQFFLTTGEDLDYLDNVHTVFGEVSEGMDVLDKINETITDQEKRPYRDIRIFHTVVLDDPYADPPGLEEHMPDASPVPTKEMLASSRIGVDEELDDMEGKAQEEIEKIMADREAKANAQLLEMVGDLPDAEVAPEENVLFVCKLNPVTTSEDLNIIFSRFGVIKSCEVIKDKKTEESLQYAFIEFEKTEECEEAYFKMDNVVIDDRRIHVDFSQSVSKLKNKWDRGKGGGQTYVIKDRDRKDDRYSLVFSDDEGAATSSKDKTHKKKKKHRHSRSESREREHSHKHKESKRSEDKRRHDRDDGRRSDDERDHHKKRKKDSSHHKSKKSHKSDRNDR